MKLIKSHPYWRLLEILPGLISWAALTLPILLSIFFPYHIGSFLIVYTILWLFRSFKLSYNLYVSYKKVQDALKTNWDKKLKALKDTDIPLSKIHHAILFVTYKEDFELIRESIKSYVDSSFDSKKIIFVFGGEERDEANVREHYKVLKEEFGPQFEDFLLSIHPKDIPGEIKGKSANATWAAKELKKYLDEKDIPYDHVILSNFDADTVAHKHYFSELTYRYLTTTDRTNKTFQPTHMFHNNIWDVPVAVRMVALSCTFWRMAESLDKEKYKSFSSRSMSFQTAVDTDYWDPSIIPEDSRQYWTAYLRSNGNHELVPVLTPVYMDAVLSDSYVKTFQSQYAQLRRWAWGVCDFPFIAINLIKHPKIPTWKKWLNIGRFLENSFFWATGPLIITFTGWIPTIFNPTFRETVFAYNLPIITSNILTLASVGIIICAIISLIIVPRHPKGKTWFGHLSLILQWLLIPIVSIFLSAIPALDAQTRLMFGWRLEYKVTEKARK